MNSKIVLSTIAIVVAFALIASPLLASEDALANHKKKGKSNSLSQSINQENNNRQSSLVVSGGSTTGSGNNNNVQANVNTGNNVAGQNNN